MDKMFSAWLMDIAKYIITALVLSTVLRDTMEGWVYYAACLLLVVVIVIFGVIFQRRAEKKENKKI